MIKSANIAFVQAEEEVTGLITKFGGQPVWLEAPIWPTSKSDGRKMTFIGQIELLPEVFGSIKGKMAYLFINGDENAEDTWDALSGENAVIIQPGENDTDYVSDKVGPSIRHRNGTGFNTSGLCEFTVSHIFRNDLESEKEELNKNKIGGLPYWVQYDEAPFDNSVLLCQLHDLTTPFLVNFGTGIGYAFIDSDGSQGKLLWQC